MSFEFDRCPVYAPFFGAMGCAVAMCLTSFGASYGMAKSGIGIMATSVLHPDTIVRNLMPPILAGILSVYGLVVSVLISGSLKEGLPLFTALVQLGSGVAVGLCGMAAGFAIGIVGDAGTRASAQQPRSYMGMMMILIFAEILGLYGMIIAIIMITKTSGVGICTSE